MPIVFAIGNEGATCPSLTRITTGLSAAITNDSVLYKHLGSSAANVPLFQHHHHRRNLNVQSPINAPLATTLDANVPSPCQYKSDQVGQQYGERQGILEKYGG